MLHLFLICNGFLGEPEEMAISKDAGCEARRVQPVVVIVISFVHCRPPRSRLNIGPNSGLARTIRSRCLIELGARSAEQFLPPVSRLTKKIITVHEIRVRSCLAQARQLVGGADDCRAGSRGGMNGKARESAASLCGRRRTGACVCR